jgi:hypothetical protein
MTLIEKFREGRKFLPDGCVERKPTIWFEDKVYRSTQVAYFLHFGVWAKNVYRTCRNPKCVNVDHLTTKRPASRPLVCWGRTFNSVQELWEHPRCYVPTVRQLQRRLEKYAPEDAVRPDYFVCGGKRYKSINTIPLPLGLARSTFYKRLGCHIWVTAKTAKKFSPDAALDDNFWEFTIPTLPRVGEYGFRNVLNKQAAPEFDPRNHHESSKGFIFRNR